MALLACPDVVPVTREGARQYARHKPEETLLFQAVQEHLSSFLCEAAASGRGMPRYVVQAFEAYLCCGILAHGFSRAYCADCRRSLLVAFSCKKRGPCPSCGARKMASEAAFVADHVWPAEAGARQWVLSLPFDLRALVALRPEVLRAVHACFTRLVFGWLKKQSGVLGQSAAHTGAVTFVQRFGGSLNLHVHFHAVVLDGVYFESRPGAEPIFLGVRGPTDAELSELPLKLEGRVTRWLGQKGLLLAERQMKQAEPDALEQATQTALRLGQLAHVDERGQVVSPPARRPGRRTGTGAHAGYSLHASTVVAAGDREGLERLLRYCARPALSLERLRETQDGRYAYELKYPSLGRTHLVLTPTELLARLSLLVAPPRYPLVRYGGLFAPAHGLRKAIVARAPGPPREEGCCRARGGGEAKEAKAGKEATAATPERTPSPSPTRADAGLARALLAGEAEATLTATTAGPKRGELLGAATSKPWLDWATLLRRTFDLDVLACPCGGRLRFIALVTERDAIMPLLESLGLPTTPPVRARARSPTLFEMDPMPVYA